ncbi:MAG: Mov34/MPN/PAD-1 family protein [Candidatus Methanomethylophilaceae archaeon]|nr:Mov34/MPN/PAD-1 family protein [Candidatus Methanomethylophilaceae archaeon]MDY0224998.1 Mov34/MPN/PAD-1 family protein [Candidatus Methanomethylophilaceae archaeon]
MMKIYGVSVDFIDGFNESAKSTYPDEFICFHREKEGVVTEMLLVPGSVFGESHSFINDWMSPIDYNKSGSAHSHPGYSNEPSEADKTFFGHMGGVHFITCQPYDRTSWKAYNSNGEEVKLELVF